MCQPNEFPQIWEPTNFIPTDNSGIDCKCLCVKVIEQSDNPVPDQLCLAGRIYKDKFMESDYCDKQALEEAIKWYLNIFMAISWM